MDFYFLQSVQVNFTIGVYINFFIATKKDIDISPSLQKLIEGFKKLDLS
ncbi:hypothetical protein LBHL_00850 [Lactobacillus helveticus]|nr:hypothetical protein LBHL_00850 [Lactobacillus helveticus]